MAKPPVSYGSSVKLTPRQQTAAGRVHSGSVLYCSGRSVRGRAGDTPPPDGEQVRPNRSLPAPGREI